MPSKKQSMLLWTGVATVSAIVFSMWLWNARATLSDLSHTKSAEKELMDKAKKDIDEIRKEFSNANEQARTDARIRQTIITNAEKRRQEADVKTAANTSTP